MERLTTEQFIEKARKIHGDKYDYSKVTYINAYTKVCIICPVHGEFWQSPCIHLSGHGCIDCVRKKKHTKETFIKESRKIHGNKYDYSKVEYKNNKTKVCVICPEHGEFWQRPDRHLQGGGCPVCGGTGKLTTDTFIKKARKVHGNKYDYSKVEYKTTDEKVCIICPEHGEFWQTPHGHLSGQGCPACGGTGKLTNETFIEKARKVHGNKYDYSKAKYKTTETKVCIICPEHGEFWQTPHGHLSGQGCPACTGSRLEHNINVFLKENKYEFQCEKSFDWLKNKKNLFLDFYLPKYNVAIECQGIQHFEPVKYFGGNKKFKEQQKSDFIKYKLCEEHGIKILYYGDIERDYFQRIYTNENDLKNAINGKNNAIV